MNRDTVIGFVLIALVLIGFSWWNQPSAEQIEAQRKEDSIAAVMKDNAQKQQAEEAARKAKAAEVAKADTTALFYQALSGESSDVVLKNGKVELTLNTKGGTLTKVVVKDFADKDGNPDVTLYDLKDQQMNFLMAGKQDNIITQELYFTPSNQSDTTVTMTAQATGGGSIVLVSVAPLAKLSLAIGASLKNWLRKATQSSCSSTVSLLSPVSGRLSVEPSLASL